MAPRTALDLISTPVPVLNRTGLVTSVGLSGDDPLAERHHSETFRVIISIHGTDGSLTARRELDPIGVHERQRIDLSAIAHEVVGDEDVLAFVHRVPISVCPIGSDPSAPLGGDASPDDYEMYRTMVQFARGGAHGGVIYETPPGLNDRRGRPGRGTALMFTSKILHGPSDRTLVCAINGSIDPAYTASVPLRMVVFDANGDAIATDEREIAAFTVSVLDMHEVVGDRSAGRNLSAVAWSSAGALIFLVIEDAENHVAVEHTHPPQAYLLADDPATRFRLKNEAIAAWDRRFAALVAR